MLVLALIFASSAAAASFDAHGSVEQVYATGLPAGASTSLIDPTGHLVETRQANFLGGTLFRNVTPGDGYHVRLDSSGELSDSLKVLDDSPAPPHPDQLYSQSIPADGYGYMTMRDGTKLAYSVHPPTDVLNALGHDLPDSVTSQILDHTPSPTLIEYSGYGYANPSGPVNGIAALANLMGFTVVDVNMRGTGCSGGAFDFFEKLQNLDGYDVIETVAHQPWVLHNKVGMLGISYGGISQLFTAQEQPPDLAAIAPLSVIDQTQTTLYPGGILNTGFAVNWALERQHEALPADPAYPNDPRYGGQPYADQQIANGDQICKANQVLHPEAANLLAKIRANDHYIPSVADPLSPTKFVNKISVPVFMACQFTDEQTGGHCPTLAENMTGTDKKWFTFENGVHTDSLDPATYNRLYDFFELYVAQEAPITKSALVQATFPVAGQAIWGIGDPSGQPSPDMTLPPDPVQQQPTSAMAKAMFDAQPEIRVLFDNGAGMASHPGWPYPAFEQSFSSFPIPGTTATSWYLGSNGSLADQKPADPAADQFTWDARDRPLTDFTGDTGSGAGGLWTANPTFNWTQDPAGSAVAYVTPPLAHNTAVIGAGRVDLWVKSSTPNVDLQATVTEVRPDGKETFVQNGWLRTKARKLDDSQSTELEPVLSLRQEDFSPMPSDQFVPVTIPLYYEGHMYRAGSRIRVRISAPNGDQPIWSFNEADPPGQANVQIGYGGDMPSRIDLPVVPGVDTTTGLPPCPSLRNEPCRDYQSFTNTPAELPPGTGGAGSGNSQGSGSENSGGSQGNSQGPGGVQGATGKKSKHCKKHKRGSHSRKHCKH